SAHYQQLALGRRGDVRVVEQPMLSAAWYVEQLRRRGTVRLPEAMTVYSEDPRTHSRAWLDANANDPAGARPLVAVEFLDDDWKAAYRLLPMGLWSAVVPRSARAAPSAWADAWSENVRRWDVESLGRSYAASGWETSEGVWYTYTLARLRALRDIAA